MSEDIESLRAEVAALRARLDEQQSRAMSRRRLLTGLTGLGVAGAAGLATARPVAAADGDPVLLGENNSATDSTFISVAEGMPPSEVILNANEWGVYSTAESIGVVGTVQFGGVAGVFGNIDGPSGSGVTGNAGDPGGIGVIGTSKAGPAIAASSELDGVTLELTPAARTGPPAAVPTGLTEYRMGAVSVDENGELWLCTASGAPGTWTRLLREDTAVGRTIPIKPFRALDTRGAGGRPSGGAVIPGQKQGPIKGGETLTLDLTAHPSVPDTATGVFGSLCVVTPSYTGSCRVMPTPTSGPSSAVNFTKGVGALSNSYMSALGPNGLSLKPSGDATNNTHLILDVAGYLT